MPPPPAPPPLLDQRSSQPPPAKRPRTDSSWGSERPSDGRWGWQGRSGSSSWRPGLRAKPIFMSEWFCQVCNKECRTQDRYQEHVAEMHLPCGEPGCNFSGPEHVLPAHRLRHVKASDGSSLVESPQEVQAWIAARRNNFPSEATQSRKAEEREKRRQSGALEESKPEMSLLEKLLRKEHDLERRGKGKGKGKFKGKDKGKDYWGKGKGGKSGKGSKGRGKWQQQSWGGKGWGNSSWDWQGGRADGGAPPSDHVLATLQLPSMLANCVPLEAPFGQLHQQSPAPRKRGLCRFFERGFCFHGDNCQYEHAGSGTAGMQALGDASAPRGIEAPVAGPPWWTLPSTLANRACGIGEGPAGEPGGVGAARGDPTTRQPLLRAQRAYLDEPEQRPRRDGLLRRLLQPEVDRYYSAILQCVRYIVATDFFKLDKARLPDDDGPNVATPAPPPAATDASSAAAQASDAAPALQAGVSEEATAHGSRPKLKVTEPEPDDAELMAWARELDV